MAIDRTTKVAFVELHEKATTRVSGDFLRHLIEAVPPAFAGAGSTQCIRS